jgi:hypothetical protein
MQLNGRTDECSTTDNQVLFREVQYFRQPWYLLAVLVIIAVVWYAFISQVVLGIAFGDNPGSDGLLWFILILAGILFPLFLLTSHLTVEVRCDGIWLRFFPFHRRMWVIKKDDFYQHEVIIYRAYKDFGGWGIRYGALGTAYNVSGSRGVMLHFPRNKRIMIGSQRPEELDLSLRLIRSSNTTGGRD